MFNFRMAVRQARTGTGIAFESERSGGDVVPLPGIEHRLTAEFALRAAIDSGVFAALRELESLDGGRAVQVVYVALIRRLPNVIPDRRRIAIDTGVSESSVKRAIGLLESAGLIRVRRERGRSSVYHVSDLRVAEVATSCTKSIRDLVRSPGKRQGRSTSGSTPSVTREPTVGSQVVQKEAKKISSKQQGAACEFVGGGECDTERVLSRWGLTSARYLVTPGDERAIPELSEHPESAARILDITLRKASWSATAGVGAKVSFLRENVRNTAANLAAAEAVRSRRHSEERQVREDESEAELRRRSFEQVVLSMSDEEFTGSCERMFAAQPGLRRLFGIPSRESSGLKLKLTEFLAESDGCIRPGLFIDEGKEGRRGSGNLGTMVPG